MSNKESHAEGPLTQLTPELMHKYTEGTLSPNMMHRVKQFLKDHPFEAEAVEGLSSGPADLSNALEDLDSRLRQRVAIEHKSQPQYWRIAAAIAIFLVSGLTLYLLLPTPALDPEIALDQESLVPNPDERPQILPSTKDTLNQMSRELTQAPSDEKTTESPQINRSIEGVKKEAAGLGASKNEDLPQQSAVSSESLAEADLFDREQEATPLARSESPKIIAGNQDRDFKKSELALLDSHDKIPFEFKVIVGKVTSSNNGAPLAGANIRIKDTDIGTVSDQNGFFHFEAPLSAQSLISINSGYSPQEVPISERPQIDIIMTEDEPALKQPAALRDQAFKKNATRATSPSGQRAYTELPDEDQPPAQAPATFAQYLEENTTYPSEAAANGIVGTVEVAFKVTPDGAMKDFEIVKKLGFGCDEAAVEIVRKGPGWAPAIRNGQAIESRGVAKIYFAPEH